MKRFRCRVFILLLLSSCSSRGHVSVSLDNYASMRIPVKDLFSQMECVPLEDSPEARMVTAGRYAYAYGDSLMAVLDLFSDYSVRIFDYQGHFIHQISQQGRGAGYYGLAYDLLFDDPSGLLVILDPTGKIIRYSIADGFSFHDEISFLGPIRAAHNICKLSEDTYILFSRSEKYQLYITSFKDGKTVPIKYSAPEWLMFSPFTSAITPLYSFDGNARFVNGVDGSVFTIKDGRLIPYIRWDLGNYRLSIKDIPPDKTLKYYSNLFQKSSYRYATQFSMTQETERYVFSQFYFQNQTNLLIYDKEADKTQIIRRTAEGSQLFLGIFHGNTMYLTVRPDRVREYVNDTPLPDSLCNHVLIKYVLK